MEENYVALRRKDFIPFSGLPNYTERIEQNQHRISIKQKRRITRNKILLGAYYFPVSASIVALPIMTSVGLAKLLKH